MEVIKPMLLAVVLVAMATAGLTMSGRMVNSGVSVDDLGRIQ